MIPLGIFFSAVSLGIFLWVVFSSSKEPLLRALKTRRANIEEAITQAHEGHQDSKEMFETYRIKLDGFEVERQSMMKQMEQDVGRLEDRIKVNAVKMAEKIKQNTQQTIRQELRANQERLKIFTAQAAIGLAREKIEKQMTDEDDRHLQEEAMNQLRQKQYGQSITREALRESAL